MGALELSHVTYARPGGRTIFTDVSFRVGDGEHVALVGANGAGKTTLLRLVAGEEEGSHTGSITVDGRVAYMPQLVGSLQDVTVRELLLSLSPPALRAAAQALAQAEAALDGGEATGLRYAKALTAWGDAGGYDAEVRWDECTTAALRRSFDEVADRRLATLSGGEQKRLALELLLRSDADVLLLDEPDNYLDVAGKEWLEKRLAQSRQSILLVSHDRELLARTAHKVVTIEARGSWTHGGSFATYHEARQRRLSRLDEEHRRFQEERDRLRASMIELKRRAAISDANAARAKAAVTKLERFEASAPAERPRDQRVDIRLQGGRTGKRALAVAGLGFPGIVRPFDTEVLFGERIGVLGPNGSGKTHFLQLLAGREVDHVGSYTLGARVVPGWFSQTHDDSALRAKRVIDVALERGLTMSAAMATLRRYELDGPTADQPFETLSGGQQARLQILTLELSGSTMLLLDEPTDNLDLASAEALEGALSTFEGTVLAVTHDRWLLRSFDRFLVFSRDGTVRESLEPAFG